MDKYFIKRRILAIGLIVECPFNEPLADCPLSDVRELPFEERIEIIQKMSDEKIGEIIGYHGECFKKREH